MIDSLAVDGILLDLGGVLYVGNNAVPGAADALRRLRTEGPPLRFLTNTTRKPRRDVVRKLTELDLAVTESEVFTAPMATRQYLRTHALRAYLICHPDLEAEFSDLVSDDPNAVVIADAGQYFTYERLNAAFRLLMQGAPLIAMGRNRYFQETGGLSLDAGPFVSALEYAAGVESVVTGKPSAAFFQAAAASLGCAPERVLMVGDDVESDVLGALASGLQGALVKTGKYRPGDEKPLGERAHVLSDFPSLVEWLLKTNR